MPERPNLLFLFPDQWRWDWLGCQDSPFGKVPVRTPNIDRLASRGVRFTHCRTNSPVCAPARACLARGRRYDRCGVPSNHENTPLDAPNLFKALRDAGYRTMTCGKCDLRKGEDVFADDGFPDWVREIGFTAATDQRGKMNGGRPPFDKPGPYMAYLREQGLMQAHIDDYERRQREASYAT
ncbi:MAG: sulfatase-like hydrolase/transferase, partial [Planctomycetes bacterium]|nr:sulfatase-like hydrolase/transferase [Planctomycetota bacterium]